MAKCGFCKGCLDVVIIDNKRYLYCFLCNKYYIEQNFRLVEVSNPHG